MSNRTSNNAAASVATYRNDPLYPRIASAVAAILEKGKIVTPVDVLIGIELLTPEHLEAWRRGRIPYLEQVIDCNLTRLSRLLRILRFHVHDLKLVPSENMCVMGTDGSGCASPKQEMPSSNRHMQGILFGPERARSICLRQSLPLSRRVNRMRKKCDWVGAD